MLAALELAATASIPSGETVIIAGPRAVTTRELVERIIEVLGIRYAPPTLPLRSVGIFCRLMEKAFALAGRQPPFSTRSIKFFTDNSSFSIGKSRELLGFDPSVHLDDGLKRTLSYARQRGLI
jgi:nucleoside-diphosphate-sugar epimerase